MLQIYQYLLQIPGKDTVEKLSTNERTYLISAIVVLVGFITSLVVYIRTLHNKMIERDKDTIKILVDVTRDFTTSNLGVKSAIEANTKSSEQMKDSADGLKDLVKDMHTTILERLAIPGVSRRRTQS